MKLLILGHGRHGKDTVAELIAKHTGLRYTSSSRACLDVIAPVIELVTGQTDKEKMFEERHQHRELWKRCISLFNALDRSALAKKILEDAFIYVGMRCDLEYEASKDLFDFVVYVDRKNSPKDETMLIKFNDDEMQYIDNSGSLEDLECSVGRLLNFCFQECGITYD